MAAHAGVANRLLARSQDSPFAASVAAAASEAAGFAAWLHADMDDTGTARSYYRMAIDRAQRAGHDLLAGYMIGGLAAFEIDAADPGYGLELIGDARRQVGQAQHPTPLAWLDSLEALGLAVARKDGAAADRAIVQASRVVESKQATTTPPWPWVFPFDYPKLAGYRALVAVRLGRPSAALSAFAESMHAAQPAPRQRAVTMLEVATAACQDGAGRKESDRADEAFRLACEALRVGIDYSSERVIARARRFRRSYDGPATSYVREFDDRARSALRLCQ